MNKDWIKIMVRGFISAVLLSAVMSSGQEECLRDLIDKSISEYNRIIWIYYHPVFDAGYDSVLTIIDPE